MKSLVIYFSHTGENYIDGEIKNIDVGNTFLFAQIIKDVTGADLFEVKTVNKYPINYYECCDKAKEELEKDIKPNLVKELDNIDGYDIIYIGGPVWWGYYPRAIITQIEKLNFNGKIVKPFTTHEGSGLGNVMDDINKYCMGATIRNGLAIKGSRVKIDKEKIESWCIND